MVTTCQGMNFPLACRASAAAGHLHPHDGHALDVVVPDDGRQLVGVVHVVELGAADDGDLAPHELLVHVGVGVGGAVRRNEQLCAVEEGSLGGHQLDLAGPLRQAGDGPAVRGRGRRLLGVRKLHHPGPGAAALVVCMVRRFHPLCLLCLFDSLLVVCRGLALLEGDGARRAAGQAVAKAVAEALPDQLCLAADHVDRALVAGAGAQPAAVALLFVDVDDLADHGCLSPLGYDDSVDGKQQRICIWRYS